MVNVSVRLPGLVLIVRRIHATIKPAMAMAFAMVYRGNVSVIPALVDRHVVQQIARRLADWGLITVTAVTVLRLVSILVLDVRHVLLIVNMEAHQ